MFEVIDTVGSESDRQKKGDQKSSQIFVIAVCFIFKQKTLCKSLIVVSTGYSDNKDVLYCGVSDGCCHRSEP